MTSFQIELVECALRQLNKLPREGWDAIPKSLRPSIAKHMKLDGSGQPDVATLPEAALIVLRNAIARNDEFAENQAL